MSTAMPPNATPDDFREQLSAWHDGALSAEASRFVAKRVLQDDGLRAELGRWQAFGDVLRGQRVAAAPAALPERVAEAIGAETAAPRRPARGRWLATAAVAGLAAVLLLPGDDPSIAQGVGEAPAAAIAAAATRLDVPVQPPLRARPLPLLLAEAVPQAGSIAHVPPLVRAPQPTPEQLAPLPAVDAPVRPWPRSGMPADAFTVDYRAPIGGASPRP